MASLCLLKHNQFVDQRSTMQRVWTDMSGRAVRVLNFEILCYAPVRYLMLRYVFS
jgi:hypothetical protein